MRLFSLFSRRSRTIAIHYDDEGLPFLDRSALIVRLGAPYREWARKIGPSEYSGNDDNTTYLLPPCDTPEELQDILKAGYYELIFEHQLSLWILDESRWPTPRTYDNFTRWFKLIHADMVVDLE